MKKLLIYALVLAMLLSGCGNVSCNHTDSNADGVCDKCDAAVQVIFDLYGVSDLVSQSNLTAIAAYLQACGEANPNALFVSAGSMWQNRTADTVAWMNDVGFTAMGAGTGEFAGGEQKAENNASKAAFPLLAINIFDREKGARVPYCAPSTVVEKGGVQIGIIGALGDGYTAISAVNRDELDIKIGDELTDLVKDEAAKLRKNGADFILFLFHDGYEQNAFDAVEQVTDRQIAQYYDTALSDGAVDLVLEAGTGCSYRLVDQYGVYHLQNSAAANGVTHAEIIINAVAKVNRVRQTHLIDAGDEDAPVFGTQDDPQLPTQNAVTTTGNTTTGNTGKPSGSKGPTGSSCQHKDGDDNGRCDLCKVSVLVSFDFYSINDLHGKFDDTDDNIGVDEMTTYFKNQRKEKDNVVLLSAGDLWQGSAESNMTKGKIITDWMNRLDFTATAIGNHEFDWGENFVAANAQMAEFPFLAINIYDRSTNQRADFCKPSVMVDKDGVQIGIIGAIGDCYSSIAVDKCDEVYFKTGSQLTSLVKAEVNRLRQQGADFIVYLIHDGYEKSNYGSVTSVTSSQISSYYDVSLSNGYVDLVFEGHTHQGYMLKDQYGVYHLQNRGDNKGGVSHASVSINAVTGTSAVEKAALVSHSEYQALADDPLVDELLKKYESEIAPANKVLGTNSRVRNSSELCQIMADLYCQLGEKTWGDQYDIVLGGGFLNTRSPYKLFAGDVTYADLQSVFPFDNQLVLCSISGSNLKSKFINTSNDSYYISYGSYGNSVKNNIQNTATYYVVVDTYTADYAPNRLTVVKRFDETTFGRDLMAEYIAAGGLS